MKIQKLLFHPIVLFRYSTFWMYRELNYLQYLLRKKKKKSIHFKFYKKVSKYVKREYNDSIYNLFMNSRKIFIDNMTNKAIEVISEDFEYRGKVLKEANEILNNSVYVLNKKVSSIYDSETNHYKWELEQQVGYKYVWGHYTRARKMNNIEGIDIKNIWEFARMQYLFTLGIAYKLTSDEKYAYKVVDIISDFIDRNELQEGPNWNVSMEVGIRVTNMILAIELIEGSNALSSKDFIEDFVISCYEHMYHIYHNQENHGLVRGNHHLAGLLGLLSVSAKFPFLPNSNRIFEYSRKDMEKEIRIQVLNDGGSFEGSLSYHRLVGEIFCFSSLICNNINSKMSSEFNEILLKMANFTKELIKPDGLIPQIGDDDSSRVFRAIINESNDHKSFINLAYKVAGDKTVKYSNLHDCFEIFKYNPASRGFQHKSNYGQRSIIFYPDSKIIRYQNEKLYFVFSAIDSSRFGLGGHTHNDICSFELSVLENNFIVDLGTGHYTSNKEIRNLLRSTKSHATVEVMNEDQKRINKNNLFDYDSYPKTNIEVLEDNIEKLIVRGSHDGYHQKYGIDHVRTIEIFKKEEKIRIIDKFNESNLLKNIYLPLHPDVTYNISSTGVLLSNNNSNLSISTDRNIEVIDALFSNGYGLVQDTNCLVIKTKSSESIIEMIIN